MAKGRADFPHCHGDVGAFHGYQHLAVEPSLREALPFEFASRAGRFQINDIIQRRFHVLVAVAAHYIADAELT